MKLFLEFEIEGLFPENAVKKLKKQDLELFFIQKRGKNRLSFSVEKKFQKKVFTILYGSCYNIRKVRYRGVLYFLSLLKKRIGLTIGALAFFLVFLLTSPFIFRIEIEGSGNYLKGEILPLLESNSLSVFHTVKAQNVPTATAQILSLNGVSFASIKKSGGVLKVQVETSSAEKTGDTGDLICPTDGVLLSLVPLVGTAQKSVGESVSKGEKLVIKTDGIVIASASVQTAFSGRYEDCVLEAQRLNGKLTAYEGGTGTILYTVKINL